MQFTYSFPTGFTFLYLFQLDATSTDGVYEPGAVKRTDSWMKASRWKRGFAGEKSGWKLQLFKWVNFVLCLAALATAGLGIYGTRLNLEKLNTLRRELIIRIVSEFMSSARPVCEPFQGNSDLYGLGIRIGIYLQWFSSWICMSLNPGSAEDLHAVNSIFIFAIIIAAIVAAASDRTEIGLRPIEAHILLQISFGYLFTVLSIWGLRVQCMTPSHMAQLSDRMAKLPSRFKAWFCRQRNPQAATSSSDKLRDLFQELLVSRSTKWKDIFQAISRYSLANFSIYSKKIETLGPRSEVDIQSGNLTWAGIQWRIMIACPVATFNVWVWFSGVTTLPNAKECDSVVFIFARKRLDDGVLTIFRLGAIMYVACIGMVFLIFSSIAVQILAFLYFSVMQWMLFRDLKKRGLLGHFQAFGRRLGSILSRIREHTHSIAFTTLDSSLALRCGYYVLVKLASFLGADEEEVPMPSDVLQAYALLSSRRDGDSETVQRDQEKSYEQYPGWNTQSIQVSYTRIGNDVQIRLHREPGNDIPSTENNALHELNLSVTENATNPEVGKENE
ncbi:MAG: hypothetical protein Q9227_006173 [Pyrenula ochraceoflavens]